MKRTAIIFIIIQAVLTIPALFVGLIEAFVHLFYTDTYHVLNSVMDFAELLVLGALVFLSMYFYLHQKYQWSFAISFACSMLLLSPFLTSAIQSNQEKQQMKDAHRALSTNNFVCEDTGRALDISWGGAVGNVIDFDRADTGLGVGQIINSKFKVYSNTVLTPEQSQDLRSCLNSEGKTLLSMYGT